MYVSKTNTYKTYWSKDYFNSMQFNTFSENTELWICRFFKTFILFSFISFIYHICNWIFACTVTTCRSSAGEPKSGSLMLGDRVILDFHSSKQIRCQTVYYIYIPYTFIFHLRVFENFLSIYLSIYHFGKFDKSDRNLGRKADWKNSKVMTKVENIRWDRANLNNLTDEYINQYFQIR